MLKQRWRHTWSNENTINESVDEAAAVVRFVLCTFVWSCCSSALCEESQRSCHCLFGHVGSHRSCRCVLRCTQLHSYSVDRVVCYTTRFSLLMLPVNHINLRLSKTPPVPIRRHKVFSIYLYEPFVTQGNVVMWLHEYHWSMLQLISSASVISDKGSQQTCICSKMSVWRDSVKNIHNIFTCEDLLARKSAVVCEILIKAAINISLLKYISIWSDFRKKYRVMTLTSSHTCTHTHTPAFATGVMLSSQR